MNWKEKLGGYADNEEILQVYEDWGETEYLKEVVSVLNRYNPEWNKEKELGSWAAEFILDLLEETEEEFEELGEEGRCARFEEMVEERYEDFRSGHQFARINNAAIQAEAAGEQEKDIRAAVDARSEEVGFPVFIPIE